MAIIMTNVNIKTRISDCLKATRFIIHSVEREYTPTISY